MGNIVRLQTMTKAEHAPDDILEMAKGKGMSDVLVVGYLNGDAFISASTSDVERVVFLLELAKRHMMDLALQHMSK